MTWSRFDDRATDSLKVRRAGTHAVALWFAAVNFCNQHHTDGIVERDMLTEVWRPIGEVFDHEAAARACVAAGLFELTPSGDFRVHDFLDYNPSKAEQRAAQKAAAERQRRCRERRAANVAVTPFVTRDDTRDAGRVTHALAVTRSSDELRERDDGPEIRPVPVTPPRPVPSRPVPNESVVRAHAREDVRAPAGAPVPARAQAPTHARTHAREGEQPDVRRWAQWLAWRDEHSFAFDAPIHREPLETAWRAVEAKLAGKLALAPEAAFERLCRAYLTWPEGTPLPGGKTPVRGDRPASWLASGVYQLAEHLRAQDGGLSSETERLRAEARAQREARA